MTTRICWVLALALAGCRTGGEPSTPPDGATSPDQPDDEGAMPDDEEPEDEEPF